MDKHAKLAVAGSLLVLLIILGLGGAALARYFAPGKEWMGLSEYYAVPEGEVLMILDEELYHENARLVNGEVYVDLATVQEKFNHRFYWDESERMLTFTTPTQIFRARAGEAGVQVNAGMRTGEDTLALVLDGEVYVLLKFVAEHSDMTYAAYTADGTSAEPVQRIVVSCTYTDYLYVNASKKTQIRVAADRKSEIVREVEEGEKLMLIDGGGTQQGGFLSVMTQDGVRGYVNKRHVGEGYYEATASNVTMPEYTSLSMEGRVSLVWHYVETMAANANLTGLLRGTSGINVVSPTWFRLAGSDGAFNSIASAEYVATAHSLGLKVWGLVKNFDTGMEVDTLAVLSHTSSRDRLTEGLVQEALACGLDGINVDFEAMSVETGPHFVQFLRELSVKCRNEGLVLSVDDYVPASYNRFYDYEEQGAIVDYVIIMAYDEHTSVSDSAGSVASISFVEKAIADTRSMVPDGKIIVGIPFYTRLWKEVEVDGETVTSIEQTPVMGRLDQLVAELDVTPVWDEETAQYYAEYEEDGARYRIWLEEERSIGEKLARVRDAGLAGIAAWRLGQEKQEVWAVIRQYVEGN